MEIHFSIKITTEELIAAIKDQNFEEFKVKVNELHSKLNHDPEVFSEPIMVTSEEIGANPVHELPTPEKRGSKPKIIEKIKSDQHPLKGKKAATSPKNCEECNGKYSPKSNAQRFFSDACKALFKEKKLKAEGKIHPSEVKPPISEKKKWQKPTMFQIIKEEREAAIQEQALIDANKDLSKIDWKTAKKKKATLDLVAI
jgi:hypothetical protein